MHISRVTIHGAGGHGKVVYDALRRSRPDCAAEVWDDNPSMAGKALLGVQIETPVRDRCPEYIHVAIGDNRQRAAIGENALARGAKLVTVIHPAASISPFARVGDGSFIAAGAILGPEAVLQEGVIVNHGSVVDHDCLVDRWCHIAPGAVLGGGTILGEGVLVGAAAAILPGVRVGPWAVIGAGAVVTADVPPHVTMVGIPARRASNGRSR